MKYSIRNQFALIFGLLMAATVLLCWFINNTFLERYYLQEKQRLLLSAYEQINAEMANPSMDAMELEAALYRFCTMNNVGVIIMSAEAEAIVTVYDTVAMRLQLIDNIFGRHDNVIQVLEEDENYLIWIKTDMASQIDYVEMWGILDSGDFFLFRIAMEGIKDSVALANRFLAYVGIFAVIISGIIIIFIAKKTTDPLMELVEISERMIDLDFEAKYQGKSKNEVALLGQNINEMSNSLEKTISELKGANNELLRDLQRKNESEAMRSEFISNVSHELKTPIALIQGYAEGLMDGVANDQEDRDFYYEVIMDEAAKMNVVVKKLLTLNELEFGQTPVVMERFDIVQMIANYLHSVGILAKQRQINIEFDQGKSHHVWADEYKVLDVVSNLVSNALNHAADGAAIRISVSELGTVLRVAVWNEGEAIAEEHIPHIFEKFYKVDEARTRSYGGSGIGLSIVKAIMEAHNQGYGVANTDGGVEFYFELDSAEKARAMPGGQHPMGTAWGKED